MKYLAIILSIITITMSALPCDDDLVVNSGNLTVITSNSSSDHHDGLSDLCSPFCTCACCSIVVTQPIFAQESLTTEIPNSELNFSYILSFSRDFSNGIFQPPQV
jgi:hypothetical protein